MALPSSGQMSMSQLNTELGYASDAQIELAGTAVRCLFNIADGKVSFSDGYSKSNAPVITSFTGQYSYTVSGYSHSVTFAYDVSQYAATNIAQSLTVNASGACGAGAGEFTYQWEYRQRMNTTNQSSTCWQYYSNGNMSNAGFWSGVTTNTLTIGTGMTLSALAQNTYAIWVRCAVTGGGTTVYTPWISINFVWAPYQCGQIGYQCQPCDYECGCTCGLSDCCCCYDCSGDGVTCCDGNPDCEFGANACGCCRAYCSPGDPGSACGMCYSCWDCQTCTYNCYNGCTNTPCTQTCQYYEPQYCYASLVNAQTC